MSQSDSSVVQYRDDGITTPIVAASESELLPEVPTVHDEDLIDQEAADAMADTFTMRRFFCGPPEVSDEQANVLREPMEEIITNDQFIEDMFDRGRPVEYADHEVLQSSIEGAFETYENFDDLMSEF